MFKTPGIPIWVTTFALIVFVVACASSFAVVQGLHGDDFGMNLSWAGRNIGLGLIAGFAILLKSPTAYIVAFIGGLSRDLSDLIGELSKPEVNPGIVIFLLIFLLAGALGLIAANKARSA